MTKKDYIAIAGMFAETLAQSDRFFNSDESRIALRTALHYLARQFCNHAHRDNSRFDENRFMAACKWEVS